MPITTSPDARNQMLTSIKRFFAEKLEDEIGDLKAALVLEFCLQEIGPTIYNGAVTDAQAWLQERVPDLEGVCYEPEFAYWERSER